MNERNKPNRANDSDTEKNDVESNQLNEIETEIDQTRHAISGDLRTLGERLSPENLKEGAKEVVSEAKNAAVETLHEAKETAANAFREAKDSAVETVSGKMTELRGDLRRAEQHALGFLRENAVPLALIGIGATWFVARQRSRESEWNREYRWGAAGDADRGYESDSDWNASASELSSRTKERARDLTRRATDRAQRWVESAEHSTSEAADRVRDYARRELQGARHAARDAEHKASEVATRARDFAGHELQQARDLSVRAAEMHPLAVGAAALAAGIGVGLALPQTQREAEILGPQRERLVGGAKEIIEDWGHTAGETARDMKESLTGARA